MEYTPSQSDQKTMDRALNAMKSYAEQTQDDRDKWRAIRKAWKLEPDKQRDGKSNIVVPLLRDAVEIIAPRIFRKRPTILGHPVDETTNVPLAEFMSQVIEYEWDHVMGMTQKMRPTSKSALVYGVGIGKQYWKIDEKTVRQKKKFLKFIPYEKKNKVMLYNDPCYQQCSVFNTYFDPAVETLQDSAMVIQRFTINKSTLKRLKGYQNLKYVKGRDTFNPESKESWVDGKSLDDSEFNDTTHSRPETVDMIEAWTDDEVITIADYDTGNPVLVRHMPNPYLHGKKPFYLLRAFDEIEPNRLLTPGLGHVVLELQEAHSTVINQALNNINLNLKKAWLVKKGANIKKSDLEITPGKVIRVNNLDDIRELKFQDISPGARFILESINAFIESASGATDIAKGLSSGDTATSDHIKNENLETRIEILRENFESFVEEIGQDMVSLIQQYMSESKTIRIFDKSKEMQRLIRFSPDQIRDAKFAVTVEAGSSVAKDGVTRTKRLLEAFDRFKDHPSFNSEQVMREIFKNEGLDETKMLKDGKPLTQRLVSVMEAEKQNELLLAGKNVPPVEVPDMDHIGAHMKYKENPLVAAHIQAEMDILESQGPGGAPQPEPGQQQQAPEAVPQGVPRPEEMGAIQSNYEAIQQ